jgi:hypothetical protein
MLRSRFFGKAMPIVCLFLVVATVTGCAGPNQRGKFIGGAGAVLAASGGAAWAVGERTDRDAMVAPGVVGVVAGIALMITAGVLFALDTACTADADCPDDQTCREVPAPAGREPYSQCVPR